MLKKFWRKLCGFAWFYSKFFGLVAEWLGYALMLGFASPTFAFFVLLLLASVLLVPIYGLAYLYEWLRSLF